VGGVVRPRPCPAGPTAGEYGGRAMRLRLGRACLLAEVVGAWQQAKGGDAWWTAGRRAGPGRSASSPERGSARATAAPAGPGPMTPVHAPRRPATGAAGRAASTAGRSTATATCSTWSTAAGRWWRSSTGSGGSGGRASAALRGMGCGHGVDGLAGAAVGSSSGLAPRWRPQGDGWLLRRSDRPSLDRSVVSPQALDEQHPRVEHREPPGTRRPREPASRGVSSRLEIVPVPVEVEVAVPA
jgi:hypothetical protein